MTRYLSNVRPGIEVGGYFNRPKNLQAFLSNLLYFDFAVEFGTFWASLHVCAFGFGFKVAVNGPLEVTVCLEVPCADVRVEAGLRFDWERDDVLRAADEKRERLQKACAAAELAGQTIDAADWESDDARKQRAYDVRRDFHKKFWDAAPDGDIDIGNEMFLVFTENGVYVDMRPELPVAFKAAAGLAVSTAKPDFVGEFANPAPGQCKFVRHQNIDCSDGCAGRT